MYNTFAYNNFSEKILSNFINGTPISNYNEFKNALSNYGLNSSITYYLTNNIIVTDTITDVLCKNVFQGTICFNGYGIFGLDIAMQDKTFNGILNSGIAAQIFDTLIVNPKQSVTINSPIDNGESTIYTSFFGRYAFNLNNSAVVGGYQSVYIEDYQADANKNTVYNAFSTPDVKLNDVQIESNCFGVSNLSGSLYYSTSINLRTGSSATQNLVVDNVDTQLKSHVTRYKKFTNKLRNSSELWELDPAKSGKDITSGSVYLSNVNISNLYKYLNKPFYNLVVVNQGFGKAGGAEHGRFLWDNQDPKHHVYKNSFNPGFTTTGSVYEGTINIKTSKTISFISRGESNVNKAEKMQTFFYRFIPFFFWEDWTEHEYSYEKDRSAYLNSGTLNKLVVNYL